MFLWLLVLVASVLLSGFGVICVGAGLYYCAEFIEEHTAFAKRVMRPTIMAVLVLHVGLWVIDRFPFLQVLVGVIAHSVYYSLLPQYPYINLRSMRFIMACVMLTLNHSLWFRYFLSRPLPFVQLLSFFCVTSWLVPFLYFISLSVDDSMLPFSQASVLGETDDKEEGAGKKKPSIVRGILNAVNPQGPVLPTARPNESSKTN